MNAATGKQSNKNPVRCACDNDISYRLLKNSSCASSVKWLRFFFFSKKSWTYFQFFKRSRRRCKLCMSAEWMHLRLWFKPACNAVTIDVDLHLSRTHLGARLQRNFAETFGKKMHEVTSKGTSPKQKLHTLKVASHKVNCLCADTISFESIYFFELQTRTFTKTHLKKPFMFSLCVENCFSCQFAWVLLAQLLLSVLGTSDWEPSARRQVYVWSISALPTRYM